MVKNLLKYELLKVIKSKGICIFLILLLISNLLQIIYVNKNDLHGNLYEGKTKILNKIEGKVTQKKYDWLVETYSQLKDRIDQGNYDTKNEDKSFFTGYAYGDYQIIENILKDYEYVVNYKKLIKKKIKVIKENIKLTQDQNWKNYNKKMLEKLKARDLSYYYDYMLMENFINNDFLYLLLLLVVLLLVIKMFLYDKQEGTYFYLNMIGKQKLKIYISKLITLVIFLAIFNILFLLEKYLIYYCLGMKNGLLQPLYALDKFAYVPINISIIQYVILNYLYQLIGSICFMMILIYSFSFFKKEIKGIFLGIIYIYLSIVCFNNHIFSIINFSSLSEIVFEKTLCMKFILISLAIIFISFLCSYLSIRRGRYYETT